MSNNSETWPNVGAGWAAEYDAERNLCTRCRAEPRHTGSELGERCLWPTAEERYAVAVALGMIPQAGCVADSDGNIRLVSTRGHDGLVRPGPEDDVTDCPSNECQIRKQCTSATGCRRPSTWDSAQPGADAHGAGAALLETVDRLNREGRPIIKRGELAGVLAHLRRDDVVVAGEAEDAGAGARSVLVSPPPITPELAARLADEGRRASEAYFERTRAMEGATAGQLSALRVEALLTELSRMAARASDAEAKVRTLTARADDARCASLECQLEEMAARALAVVAAQPGEQAPAKSWKGAPFEEIAITEPRRLVDLLLGDALAAYDLTFAAEAARHICSDDSIRALLELLEHQSPLVREGAIYGLSTALERSTVRDHLVGTARHDAVAGVREAAAMALEPESYPRDPRGLLDAGATARPEPPCCARVGSWWCYLAAGHPDQHEYPPTRELPRGEFDKGRVRRST